MVTDAEQGSSAAAAPLEIVPVIMCGGSGTRLWPISRESLPKQFIGLLGKESTFQAAARRIGGGGTFAKPIIVTNADSRFIVAEQLLEVGVSADIVLEPQGRESAAAVAVATTLAAQRNPDAIVLVLAADHMIEPDAIFAAACAEAASVARGGILMTLGITPSAPSSAYGYIQKGAEIAGSRAFRVARFIEKPDREAAERMIGKGALWNSGNFVFPAALMLREFERFAPEVLAAAQDAVAKATRDLDFIRLDAAAFCAAPKVSIDYAVMERTDAAGVLPVSFSWSDVGTWDALWEVAPQDASGNFVRGRAEVLGSRNSLIYSNHEGLTAVIGVEDLVVVATDDAVLVSSRTQAHRVKDLVVALRAKGHEEADAHRRIYRPWGWYQRIDLGARFQVKRIMLKPKAKISLQRHFHRAEHWIVVSGTAQVTIDGTQSLLGENDAAHVPIGAVHRLANPGLIPLELIEVQVGSYTGEDDIVRIEDSYGR